MLKSAALSVADEWRRGKDWPPMRYVARPVYRFVAARTNRTIGVVASFLITDLVVHQFLTQALACAYFGRPCHFEWVPLASGISFLLAIPVIYARAFSSAHK